MHGPNLKGREPGKKSSKYHVDFFLFIMAAQAVLTQLRARPHGSSPAAPHGLLSTTHEPVSSANMLHTRVSSNGRHDSASMVVHMPVPCAAKYRRQQPSVHNTGHNIAQPDRNCAFRDHTVHAHEHICRPSTHAQGGSGDGCASTQYTAVLCRQRLETERARQGLTRTSVGFTAERQSLSFASRVLRGSCQQVSAEPYTVYHRQTTTLKAVPHRHR